VVNYNNEKKQILNNISSRNPFNYTGSIEFYFSEVDYNNHAITIVTRRMSFKNIKWNLEMSL
jgi:hypothetical protein